MTWQLFDQEIEVISGRPGYRKKQGIPGPRQNRNKMPKLSSAFKIGEDTLDVKVSRGVRGYSSTFYRKGSAVKLSLEQTDQDSFSRALLHYYYFRTPERKFGLSRKIFARLGFHNRDPIEMEYCDQKYKFKLPAEIEGRRREMQMFYSPVVNHLVVRAV